MNIDHNLIIKKLEQSSLLSFDKFYYKEHVFKTINDTKDIDIIKKFYFYLIDFLRSITQQDIEKLKEQEEWFIEQKIQVYNKSINIIIGNNKGKGPHYDNQKQAIMLDISNLKTFSEQEILFIIIHEIGHAISKRIDPNILSKIGSIYSKRFSKEIERLDFLYKNQRIDINKYNQEWNIWRSKEMEEFDAACTTISTMLYQKYLKLPQTKKDLSDWIRLKCNPQKMPTYMNQWKELIEIWYSKPSLFKKFVDGMYTLVFTKMK